MTAKRRPKVKVRYVPGVSKFGITRFNVCAVGREPSFSRLCDCYSMGAAKRIAAALNVYEARRRGEL